MRTLKRRNREVSIDPELELINLEANSDNHISEIAKYNLANNTNFYTIEQVKQHQSDLQELANLQADYDKYAEAYKLNPNEDPIEAYKYSGSRPETIEDLYRVKGFKSQVPQAYVGAAMTGPVAFGLATNPFTTLGGLYAGIEGTKAFDNYIHDKTGYNSWGELLRQGNDWGTVGNFLTEFTNPVGIATGTMGSFAGNVVDNAVKTGINNGLRYAAGQGVNVGRATNTLRGQYFDRQFSNLKYSSTPLEIPVFTKTTPARALDLSKVETESVLKPWRSDPSKTNETTRVYLKGQKDRGYFELVKDNEPGNYSVHFKPADKNNSSAFNQEEKALLFQSIADLIPEGGNLSTWGSVSRGGVAGLNRFANLGFNQTGTRLVTSKPDATRIFIGDSTSPSYVKVPNTPFQREVVPRSRPISEAERIGMPRALRRRYNLSDADYQTVLADANDFAKKYGYSEIADSPEALQQIQDMYRRHSTFARVIPKVNVEIDPEFGLPNMKWGWLPEEQVPYLNMSEEARAYHAATKGYPMQTTDRVFVTGNAEAINNYSGAEGDKIFAVRRPISLGHNPLEWRKRAEFSLEGPKHGSDVPTPSSIFQTDIAQNGSWELFLGTGRLSAKPYTDPSQISRAFNPNSNGYNLGWLQQQGFKLPRTHLQGEDAIKMFKEYGVVNIPENSKLVESLRRYVPEVRERYGLVGNNNITDEEILGSLYKKAIEIGGDTAAVNEVGEPLVLFRGDTRRYPSLMWKRAGENMSGADNELGNLFLGELPGQVKGEGLDRYLGTYVDAGIRQGVHPPDTKAAAFTPEWAPDVKEYFPTDSFGYTPEDNLQWLYSYNDVFGDKVNIYKIPANDMEFGANDINAFVIRTPTVRDATEEISVLTGLNSIPREKQLGENLVEHYQNLIKSAQQNNQGLLISKPRFKIESGNRWNGFKEQTIPIFRDEHEYNTYFALPNFNIRGAKHLLPYDFRVSPQWGSRLIYRKQGGKLCRKK